MTNYYYFPNFRGIYYQYNKKDNRWTLYRDYTRGTLMMFCANQFRVDECLQIFINEEHRLNK